MLYYLLTDNFSSCSLWACPRDVSSFCRNNAATSLCSAVKLEPPTCQSRTGYTDMQEWLEKVGMFVYGYYIIRGIEIQHISKSRLQK